MRGSACITLVMASAAMLVAGISTRGARADRGVDVPDRDRTAVHVGVVSQRPQQAPQVAARRPGAQPAALLVGIAAAARHPAGPETAREGRDEDHADSEQFASLDVKPARKMRALSMEALEMPIEAKLAQVDRPAQGRSGAANAGTRRGGDEDGLDAGRSVIRFDRVVININLPGFGS